MKKTNCECNGPGYCKRHNVPKSQALFNICQQREDYFQRWEEGLGPGQRSFKRTEATTPQPQEPLSQNIFSLGKRYLNEKKIWQQAGQPLRTDEEIERIFRDVCASCEHVTKKKNKLYQCRLCGCFLKPEGSTFNKIAWATTNCPAIPPKWTAEIELPEEEKKELEQKMFQDQEEKQKNGLQMKDAVAHVTPPPVKRSGCGCNG
jgi:hypothetical protein